MRGMHRSKTRIELAEGTADMDVFHPDGSGPWPAVIFYMDGIGVRDALREMAARFASHGYFVVLPDMFYRSQPFEPFDAASAFTNEAERARLMPILMRVTNEVGMKDTARLIDWLGTQKDVAPGPIGCVGYCLGGRLALAAAGSFPDRIAAAASIHGGRLATTAPDSPHLGAPKIRAQLYFAAAAVDQSFTPEDRARLGEALGTAGVSYIMDVFQATHGFAVPGTPVYDRAVSEKHFERVTKLFDDTLRAK
jgi:carboxymethylenebutenolidase